MGVSTVPSAGIRRFVARQPIFDRRLRVYAYELLFRSGPENVYSGQDPTAATRNVIASSSLVMDLRRLTSGRRAFINVTREILLEGSARLLPPEVAVLEILETVNPDEEIVEACRELRREGYRFALDDVVSLEPWEPLLELVDIVKVDFLLSTPEQRITLDEARRFNPRVRLLAEKVESHDDVKAARKLGYSLFQGFFFSKPVMHSETDISTRKTVVLSLLSQIHRPDLNFEDLERVIKQDPSLCYKLLRYINAAYIGLRCPMRSVRRALVYLGSREIRRWASLILVLLAADDQPDELVRQSLVRGRFCELLAPMLALEERAEDLYFVGAFSMIDTMLGRPMGEILQALPIPDDVKEALTGGDNQLRQAYELNLAYESSEWGQLQERLPGEESNVTELYMEALEWGAWCTGVPVQSS